MAHESHTAVRFLRSGSPALAAPVIHQQPLPRPLGVGPTLPVAAGRAAPQPLAQQQPTYMPLAQGLQQPVQPQAQRGLDPTVMAALALRLRQILAARMLG